MRGAVLAGIEEKRQSCVPLPGLPGPGPHLDAPRAPLQTVLAFLFCESHPPLSQGLEQLLSHP